MIEFKPKSEPPLTRLVAWTSNLARKARRDPSAWSLVGANAFAGAVALFTDMSARELVLVYWAQSVVILLCGGVRFALMRERDPEFFLQGTLPPVPLREKLEGGFIYFGFWTVLHAGFVASIFWDEQANRFATFQIDWATFLLCLAVFAAHHVYSLVHNLRADAAGQGGDRSGLFIIPFFRMFPMAVLSIVVVKLGVEANMIALAFAAVAKTVADLLSHAIEHHMLQARDDDTPYVS